jgi:hypothetical protein
MNRQRPNRRDLSSQETRSFRDPLGEAGFTKLIEPPEKLEVTPDSEAEHELELDPDHETKQKAGFDGDADGTVETTDGEHQESGELLHDDPIEELPPAYPIGDYYYACYADCWAEGEPGRRFIAGYEGITGREINSRSSAEGRDLLSIDEQVVGRVGGEDVSELNELEAAGFIVRCLMVVSLYHTAEKRFSATVAFIAYNSTLDELQQSAMQEYIKGMASRLGFGSRPELQLDQEQFDHVLSSSGRWYMTKDLPELTYPSGTFIHRRRRSMSDSLISAAVEHRMGCNILTWAFFAALIAFIYLVFFR